MNFTTTTKNRWKDYCIDAGLACMVIVPIIVAIYLFLHARNR